MEEPAPRHVPSLLFIVGPPAVGKMTVGNAIAARTGMRVFHNHMSIEPVLRLFEHGTPQFRRLVGEFRRLVFEEAAGSDVPGLIFTYVWAFDLPSEQLTLESYALPFAARGAPIRYLELSASEEVRLERNGGASRLAEKPSKQDLEWSRCNLVETGAKYRLNSAGEFDDRDDYLRIDNAELSPEEVAERTIAAFGLPLMAGDGQRLN